MTFIQKKEPYIIYGQRISPDNPIAPDKRSIRNIIQIFGNVTVMWYRYVICH